MFQQCDVLTLSPCFRSRVYKRRHFRELCKYYRMYKCVTCSCSDSGAHELPLPAYALLIHLRRLMHVVHLHTPRTLSVAMTSTARTQTLPPISSPMWTTPTEPSELSQTDTATLPPAFHTTVFCLYSIVCVVSCPGGPLPHSVFIP